MTNPSRETTNADLGESEDPSGERRVEAASRVASWAVRLRAARVFAGRSQATLARELGYSQKAVSLIETGERDPSLTFYLAAVDLFAADGIVLEA